MVSELLAKALQCEHENQMEQSEQYYLQALAEYPDDKDVLCHVAIAFFNKGDYEKALDLFVKCYSHPDQSEATKEDVLNQILIAYYQPNIETLKSKYEKNIQDFLSYEHNYISSFIEFEELPLLCIPRSNSVYYIFEKCTKKFKGVIDLNETITSYPNVSADQCVVAINLFHPLQLESLAEQTRDPGWVNNVKRPIYLICADAAKMQQYLQLVDYAPVLALNRFVAFSDCNEQSEFRIFLEDHQAYLPNAAVGDSQYFERINEVVKQAESARESDIVRKQLMIEQLAETYDKEYYKKLFLGSYNNIRILFYTSRFTQVVQYATRDFMQACQDLGIQCEMVIEKSDLHRTSQMELVHRIADFKPNVIFRVNFFKSDFQVIPANMMFITWMQDPAYQITSSQHAQEFDWNDFSLVYSRTWREKMMEIGYDGSRLAVQINPIDEGIFQKREMSQAEKEFYTSDIAFPGNYQRPEENLARLITRYTTDILDHDEKSRMANVLISTYEAFRSRIANNELICKEEQCATVINEMAALLDVKIESNVVKQIAQDFFHPLLYNLQRKITLKWLIDAGFQVKLWGLGWDKDPDFKAHAAGVLKHGEELAKMYSCTKIVPATFFWFTSHARSWESTSCGALCMARYIPPEVDFANIRECFTEDEDFVFYHDREDLINRVKYYLTNEDERQRIAENGRKKVLQTMTYASAVSKCLKLIKDNVVK